MISLLIKPAAGPRGKSALRRTRPRFGGTLVETAICMSLLLMLSFGIIEFGYFFYVKNMMAGAARNGVRAAVPAAAMNSDVTSAVATAMNSAGFPSSSYSVTINPSNVSGLSPGTPITVSVNASWGTIGLTPLSTAMGGINSSKVVTVSAVMQREQ
jgi:Flp pilus assembly protein TadG